MNKHLSRLLMAVSLISALPAQAGVSPLGIAIMPPVQFPPADFTVAGARASVLWGRHRYVYGFDIGAIGNITEQANSGVAAAGIFNLNYGAVTVVGLQAAGITNINKNKLTGVGVQVAGIANSNLAEATLFGAQVALANLAGHTSIRGIQAGVYNEAYDVAGLQVGVINSAQNLHGLQIGLLNSCRNGLFSVAPILNVGF